MSLSRNIMSLITQLEKSYSVSLNSIVLKLLVVLKVFPTQRGNYVACG